MIMTKPMTVRGLDDGTITLPTKINEKKKINSILMHF